MKLEDFEKEVGLDRFTFCVESKKPYWFKNYYAPLVIEKSYEEQVKNNIVLTVLANQNTNEVVAVCTPTRTWNISFLEKECLFIGVYLDVAYDGFTAPDDIQM